jgi:hypothetical protein
MTIFNRVRGWWAAFWRGAGEFTAAMDASGIDDVHWRLRRLEQRVFGKKTSDEG